MVDLADFLAYRGLSFQESCSYIVLKVKDFII